MRSIRSYTDAYVKIGYLGDHNHMYKGRCILSPAENDRNNTGKTSYVLTYPYRPKIRQYVACSSWARIKLSMGKPLFFQNFVTYLLLAQEQWLLYIMKCLREPCAPTPIEDPSARVCRNGVTCYIKVSTGRSDIWELKSNPCDLIGVW